VLRQALLQGVKWRLLARNAADAVEPPKPSKGVVRAMTEGETKTLLKGVREHALYVPVLLALTTGMRRGEILGLRWDDVDLGNGQLSVTQTLEQTREGLRLKVPKTQRGRRVVALGSVTVDALRRHKAQQAARKLRLGPAFQDQGLVFPSPDGNLWKPDKFSYDFSVLAEHRGIARVRFHDLRHTHATELLRGGVHPKIVSERLGHSTIGITLDVYSHVMPGMQEEAVRKFDEALQVTLAQSADEG
jgi:integrase